MIPAITVSRSGAAELTPPQKRFNALMRQLEQARRILAAWKDSIPLYAQAHTQLVLPLTKELAAARREWAFMLDGLSGEKGWTAAERRTMGELISSCAAELLAADEDDAELKALHDKHAEVDFETEQREARLVTKAMMEAVTGIDLGDAVGIDSDDDLMERLLRTMSEAEAEPEPPKPARPRRKTAAQQRREAAEQQATQSVREIFRKLASALHPDREGDADRHREKTALMQKVNQAYAANDLLTLLELQLEIEQIDATHIATASAERLKHYNKVLAEQLDELKTELVDVEMSFRFDFGLDTFSSLSPAKLGLAVERQARELRAEIAVQRNEMRTLYDRAATKRWLKTARQRLNEERMDDWRF